ncbi:MAG: RidA family protein [Bdellovibrionales bacterium]|nr:RidA family protein [Ramlibacter sp.]
MTQANTSRRPRSIEIEGVTHGAAPIPAGARVGNMIYSSGISGKDPANDKLAADGPAQSVFMFQNMRTLLKNGGATLEDVVHVTAFVKDNSQREALNAEWLKCFPDPHDRPARHTLVADLQNGLLMQIEIVAVVQER